LPETIIEVARSFKFEEDSNWNARLGRVLRQAGHYEIAKFHLEKAVSQAGPTERFRSLTGLALLFDGQENYKEAIDAVERGLKAAKEDPSTSETEKTRIRRLWTPQLLRWYYILEELDSGILLGREMLDSFPEQYASATRYILMLVDAKQYATAMEVLRKASQETVAGKECTRLSDWCIQMMWKSRWEVDFYWALVNTCRAMNELEFARTTYLDALKAAPKIDPDAPLLLQADYATLLLREFRKPKKAAHMLEMILEDVKKGRKDSASALVRIVVVDLLCEIYSSRAIIGGKNSKEAVSAMGKLANIWNQQPKSHEDPTEDIFEGDVFMTTRNSTLCLASLYRAFGEPEKGRQFFKDHLKLGLDLLTDDDPENDWEGYRKISETLSRAGDNINALAAQALVCPKLIPDDSSIPPTPGGTIPLPVGAQERFSAVCDGCETANEYATEKMYSCLFCVDISFDADCYKLLMEDKLPFKICGKEHEFFYVPELKPFPKGSVPVDGKIVPVKEWLADVRKQWAI
jgi:tetratricopeptide (TPR) repeat protein